MLWYVIFNKYPKPTCEAAIYKVIYFGCLLFITQPKARCQSAKVIHFGCVIYNKHSKPSCQAATKVIHLVCLLYITHSMPCCQAAKVIYFGCVNITNTQRQVVKQPRSCTLLMLYISKVIHLVNKGYTDKVNNNI